MAIKLIEAAKQPFEAGEHRLFAVIALFAESSPILNAMSFETIDGQAMTYNREEAPPGVEFRGVNEAYNESTGVISPQSDALKIIGSSVAIWTWTCSSTGQEASVSWRRARSRR